MNSLTPPWKPLTNHPCNLVSFINSPFPEFTLDPQATPVAQTVDDFELVHALAPVTGFDALV